MTKPAPPARYQRTNSASTSGGYGEVEIWHDTSLDRDVAIKWTSPKDAKQTLAEVRALSQYASPHIVEIYDIVFSTEGQLRGIVLEYLTGQGLESIDLTDESETQYALELLYQMARGLAHLHEAGLVHRDVKPENAVCTGDGRLKLVDFGLATPGKDAQTLEAKGTMAYAAPEMFGKPPITVTTAMDVYSFGRVCWMKLTDGLPKVGGLSLVPDRAYYPLPSIATKRTLPRRLAALIDRALAWAPSERPSMSEISDALLAELTFGRHAACVMLPGKPSQAVSTDQRRASSLSTGHGSVEIGYDGYRFTIKKVQGDVFVNNAPAMQGNVLQPGCLLTFGDRSAGASRLHVPFRESWPEIVF